MDITRFKRKPLLGILRGIEPNEIRPIIDAAASAGLEAIEITMNTAGAAPLINTAVEVSGGRVMVGAGTVLNAASMREALDAGATFIVTPVLIEEVADYCRLNKIPFFPGALTPQEIYRAWQSGATMVKVFPSGVFGPEYFREIKGPFQSIELLACGGVTPANIAEYFRNGASAAAFGASVFRREWLLKEDYKRVAALIKDYLERIPAIGV